MEIALSHYCGPDDVITPVSFGDEIVRLRMGGRLPQNYGDSKRAEEKYRKAILKNLPAAKDGATIFYNHMSAVDIKNRLTEEQWNRLYKFTIERHPYEKAVSLAYFEFEFLTRKKPSLFDRLRRTSVPDDFDAFLEKVVEDGRYRNYELYADNAGLLVDDVLLYENINEELIRLGDKIGIELARIYPKTKHNFRKDRRPAATVLSDNQKEKIYLTCKEEFEAFGFER